MEHADFFYIVWGEDRLDSRVRHNQMSDARKEAERLAVNHPGMRFYVLLAKGFAVHAAAKWTDCEADPEIPF